jgi:hypothetical protein
MASLIVSGPAATPSPEARVLRGARSFGLANRLDFLFFLFRLFFAFVFTCRILNAQPRGPDPASLPELPCGGTDNRHRLIGNRMASNWE